MLIVLYVGYTISWGNYKKLLKIVEHFIISYLEGASVIQHEKFLIQIFEYD